MQEPYNESFKTTRNNPRAGGVLKTGEPISDLSRGHISRFTETRGVPRVACDNNGSEFTSRAYAKGTPLARIRQGKPTENGFVQSFQGKLRDEFSES
jgi:transposase InsO family protein